VIETERLRLRRWRDEELPILAAWNADPGMTHHFGRTRTQAETAERFALMRDWERTRGFTFWAVERKADGLVVGNVGLKPLTVPWPEPDDIEIGWLVAQEHWGQGHAVEAARAVLARGLALAPRVVALIASANLASVRVAERIGMLRTPSLDFDHPDLPEGSPHRHHVVFAREA
jgi:RimJ/RimL family protein N-acetyltransferase